MNQTDNYNLNLPEDNDIVKVEDLNENFQIIDEELNKARTSVDTGLANANTLLNKIDTNTTNTQNIVSNSTYGNSAIKTQLNTTNTTVNTINTNVSANKTTLSTVNTNTANAYNIVNNSTYGNSALNTKLNTVNTNTTNAYNIVNNSTYGNSALNTKLTNTYNIVNSSTYGNSALNTKLTTVDTNTTNTYNIVNNSTYGNSALNTKLNTVNTNTTNAYNIVNNSTYGNSALNTKLTNTYNIVNSSTYGNSALNTKLTTVNANFTNVIGGLSDIKTVVDNNKATLDNISSNSSKWIDNSKLDNLKVAETTIASSGVNTVMTESNASSLLNTVLSVSGKGTFFGFYANRITTGGFRVTIDGKVVSFVSFESAGYIIPGIVPLEFYKICSNNGNTSTSPIYLDLTLLSLESQTCKDISFIAPIPTFQSIVTSHTSSYVYAKFVGITEPFQFNSSLKIEFYNGPTSNVTVKFKALYQLD